MRIIKNVLIASAITLGMSSGISYAGNISNSSGSEYKQSENQAKLNFVIEGEGSFKILSGNKYQIVMELKSIDGVLAMTKTPNNGAKRITLEEFLKLAHSGKDSFDVNPPNASVVMNNGQSGAFEIVGFKEDVGKNTMTFSLVLLGKTFNEKNNPGKLNGQSGHISLYIDDLKQITDPSSVLGNYGN